MASMKKSSSGNINDRGEDKNNAIVEPKSQRSVSSAAKAAGVPDFSRVFGVDHKGGGLAVRDSKVSQGTVDKARWKPIGKGPPTKEVNSNEEKKQIGFTSTVRSVNVEKEEGGTSKKRKVPPLSSAGPPQHTPTSPSKKVNNISPRKKSSPTKTQLLDIYGRPPMKEPRYLVPCPNCNRQITCSRLAMHMEKCMGISPAGNRRGGASAATAKGKSSTSASRGNSGGKSAKASKQVRRRISKI